MTRPVTSHLTPQARFFKRRLAKKTAELSGGKIRLQPIVRVKAWTRPSEGRR